VSRLVNSLQAVARYEVERRTYCELAVVTSVFDGDDGDDAQTVSIRMRDSGEVITRVPVAVPLTGLAALPREGDVVLVLFAHGETSSPVVVGQVYSDVRRPPQFTKDEAVLQWPGDADDPDAGSVMVVVKSDGDEREMRIALGGNKDALVRVADGAIELTSGGVSLLLGHSSNSDGTAVLSAGGTKVELAQDGDLKITSATNLTLKATKIELNADVSLKINGQIVEIN
jgi:phage baseplate assembly protein gpV